jgi:hypothetical protein
MELIVVKNHHQRPYRLILKSFRPGENRQIFFRTAAIAPGTHPLYPLLTGTDFLV